MIILISTMPMIRLDPANAIVRLSNRAVEGNDTSISVVKFSSQPDKSRLPERVSNVK